VVVALHDLSLAARFCHRVIILHHGAAICAGPPQDVMTPDHLAAAYGIAARYHTIEGVPLVLPLDVLP
jgi:iron complex transport system ATP-binding protein